MTIFTLFPFWYTAPLAAMCVILLLIGACSYLYEPKDRKKHEHYWMHVFALEGRYSTVYVVVLLITVVLALLVYFTENEVFIMLHLYFAAVPSLLGWAWLGHFISTTAIRICTYFIEKRKRNRV